MRVDQAIFGEVRSGHALRAASGDTLLAAALGPRLDLPDTAPPGTDWSPYVSGFPLQDCYVVARTFRDPAASRSGMVLAHALIAPLDAMLQRSNLASLFEALITQPVAPTEIAALDIKGDALPSAPAALTLAAASLLVQRGPGPVVLLGHNGLESLVAGIWVRLTPALRRSFAFRLSFGPSDLTETQAPALVCTPTSLVARWQGFRVIDPTQPQPPSLAVDLLTGAAAGEALEDFRIAVGAAIVSFGELALLEQAYRFSALEAETFANLIAAMRLVERLSPDPSVGADGKWRLLDRLVHHIGEATAADVLTLRNADFAAFGPIDVLWSALGRWVAHGSFPPAQDAEFIAVVEAANQSEGALASWRAAITAGFADAGRTRGKIVAEAFWRWSERVPAVVEPLWRALSPSPQLEEALVAAAPNTINSATAGAVLDRAAAARMYRLHGLAAASAFAPDEAIERQLAVEPETSDAGLRLVVRSAAPGVVVASAIECNVPRLTRIAAELVAKTPRLLRSVDLAVTPARSLWNEALAIDIAAWRGPANPATAFRGLLNDYLDGRSAANALIAALSSTELADLTDYPRRADLWAAMPEPARGALLSATASGWLRRMQTEATAAALEPALTAAVLVAPDFDPQLSGLARTDPARGVQLLLALPGLTEAWFRRWQSSVVASGRRLSMIEAETLGGLIDRRGWRDAAQDLLSASTPGRPDLKPALRACVALFGFFDRWAHGLAAITATEKWDSFEAVASELYPRGPDEDGLWSRAGGNDSDLVVGGSGRSRWRSALLRVRFGGGVKAQRLLKEMLRDYVSNTELQFLARDAEFGG